MSEATCFWAPFWSQVVDPVLMVSPRGGFWTRAMLGLLPVGIVVIVPGSQDSFPMRDRILTDQMLDLLSEATGFLFLTESHECRCQLGHCSDMCAVLR